MELFHIYVDAFLKHSCEFEHEVIELFVMDWLLEV